MFFKTFRNMKVFPARRGPVNTTAGNIFNIRMRHGSIFRLMYFMADIILFTGLAKQPKSLRILN